MFKVQTREFKGSFFDRDLANSFHRKMCVCVFIYFFRGEKNGTKVNLMKLGKAHRTKVRSLLTKGFFVFVNLLDF